ncbi:hypothetical protein UZS93_14215 [Escherichia coli]|nr:hypothetical protein [Escherichia coli]MDY8958005.1 hypothetical protein [Escherichia coli]MDY8997166.1 hypothetical protein [Escherichia coli]MDY9034185.1 hypothetical protein [Escherichia coli]
MTRIASPFAASGDKEQIPQTKQDTGEISFSEGYGPDYEKDLDNDTGAKTIERAKLNWLLCLVTSEIKKYQEQGVPDYISKEDNGGIDYPYAAAAMVRYNNKIYYSLKDANTDKPDTNSWSLLDPSEYLSVGGGTINGDLTITGSLDINGEQPYTKSNPPPATPNSLSIGTVTTLEPGAPATAEITGEAPEQTLSLGIPAGAPGASGSSSVKISSNGNIYKPDDAGVITLGSVAGSNIAKESDKAWESRLQIPEWTPAGSCFSVSASASIATVIDWSEFIFTAGCSYSISKESTNDPLTGKGKDDAVAWVVTCLSNSYLSTSQNGSFLIVREASKKIVNDVFFLYRYQPSINYFKWAISTIPMLAI